MPLLAHSLAAFPLRRQVHHSLLRRSSARMSSVSEINDQIGESVKVTAKRKVAFVAGYTGSDYYGVQFNPNVEFPTIENELRKALLKADLVMPSNGEDLSRLHWSRSSRTDKGVHASRIVFSAKVELNPQDVTEDSVISSMRLPKVVENINKHLPDDIRVFGCIKCANGFNAKDDSKWRAYNYIFPLRLLKQGSYLQDEDMNNAISIEESQTLLDRFNEFLSKYEGSNSFHNFHRMSLRDFRREDAFRQRERRGGRNAEISNVDSEDEEFAENEEQDSSEEVEELTTQSVEPNEVVSKAKSHSQFVYDANWKETPRSKQRRTNSSMYLCHAEIFDHDALSGVSEPMVRVHIVGKFFLLHQIRIMISAAIMSVRHILPPFFVPMALHLPIHFPLPLAPAEGLVLANTAFSRRPPQLPSFPQLKKSFSLADQQELPQLFRFVDFPVSHFSSADLLPFQKRSRSNEWTAAVRGNGANGSDVSLLSDEEFHNSELFFTQKILPRMIDDWQFKTVPCRQWNASTGCWESAESRPLAASFAAEMQMFSVAPETMQRWETLCGNDLASGLDFRRAKTETASDIYLAHNVRVVHENLSGLLLLHRRQTWKNRSEADDNLTGSKLLDNFLRTGEFESGRTTVGELNFILRQTLSPHEISQLRRKFPHRQFLPSAVMTALVQRFQLYPGLPLAFIVRLLATRAIMCSDPDERKMRFGDNQGIIAELERELLDFAKLYHGEILDDYLGDRLGRRNLLLKWLQLTLGLHNNFIPSTSKADQVNLDPWRWLKIQRGDFSDNHLLCIID